MQTSTLVIHQVPISLLDRHSNLFRIVSAVCIINALVLIWAHRFLPISDYPDWIFEGSVAAELLQGKALASYTFKNYPVPNAAAVALIGLLDLVLSPEVSGKVVLSLCVLLLALTSIYFLKSLRREATSPLLIIPLLFLPNTFFFWESCPIFSVCHFSASTADTYFGESTGQIQSIGGLSAASQPACSSVTSCLTRLLFSSR